MKRSKKPTEYVMIKASTTSNEDAVEFAILHISPKWIELTLQRLVAISEFKANMGLNHHCFWDEPIGYYSNPAGKDLSKKIFPKHDDWAFITLDPAEINALPIPKTSLNAHQFMITKDGIAHYKAYSKYSKERFETVQFNLLKLITKLLKNMKKTRLTFLMATICLNFSYGQMNEKSKQQSQLQLFQYGFSGFKSGYKPGFKVKNEVGNRGKTIIVRNYTVEQLFAIAYGAGSPISHERVIIDVIEPKKLQEIRCYKLFVPQNQATNFYTIMQQNLGMEFPDYKITIEQTDDKTFLIITDEDT